MSQDPPQPCRGTVMGNPCELPAGHAGPCEVNWAWEPAAPSPEVMAELRRLAEDEPT